MYPDGCKLDSNGNRYTTNAEMRIYRNGVLDSTAWAWESDNYGYVNKVWPAGSYSVFVKVAWHSDDVKDYTFRTYFPSQFVITKNTYATSALASAAFGEMDFASAKSNLASFGSSSNTLYKWQRGWWGSTGYFLSHSTTTSQWNCDYTIQLTANAKSA